MGQFYTVSFAKRLDGEDSYGNITYSTKFQGEADSVLFKVSPSTIVSDGSEFYGRIETLQSKAGKPYRKFTREQITDGGVEATTIKEPSERVDYGAAYKPNNDGQRQSMCINNAAAYVNITTDPANASASPKTWANTVHEYATALYQLGDLEAAATTPADPVEPSDKNILLDDIDDMFPGSKAVPANS